MSLSPLERLTDPPLEEVVRLALDGLQARLWTALPAVVDSFDHIKLTCTAHVAISFTRPMPDGTRQELRIPQLLDVPVVFPSGGGFTLTFPITPGDECLIVFASRCIDSWWQSGAAKAPQPQAEFRMHHLSDGFAFVGARSQVRLLGSDVSGETVQLRSDEGDTFVELTPDGVVNITAPGGINLSSMGPVVVTASQFVVDAPVTVITATVGVEVVSPLLSASGDIIDNVPSNVFTVQDTRDLYTVHEHDVSGVDDGSHTVTSGPPRPP